MPTAIVTRAMGMTGGAIVKELSDDPQWTKVYTLSRSQKGQTYDKIVHATLDLQSSAGDMAKQLSEVSAEHVFFCAYLAKDDEGEAAKVNSTMVKNFLDALEITGAAKQLRRIILTAGVKQHGAHLGQPRTPATKRTPGSKGPTAP